MNTGKVQAMHTSHAKEQTENNTTSWIGCYPGNKKEISKGQTFLANSGGSLEGIEVKFYGFKLASHNSFIGIAEAVGSAKNPPLSEGREWKFEDNGNTDSFRYMSLAFKIAVKAA